MGLRAADFVTRVRDVLKRRVGGLLELAAGICFVGFFVAICLQVFARFVIHYPVQWTEEFARMLYIAMVCLGAAVAVDEHSRLSIGLDFVAKRFPRGYRLLTLLIDATALVVLLYIALGSYNRTVRGWTNYLPATGFRWAYFYLPFLIGSVMLMIYTILSMVATLLRLCGKEVPE